MKIYLTDEQYKTVIDLAQNDINQQWIQKVKDKIEEIGEKIKYEENEKVVIYLHKQKNILQELLESEERVMNEEEKKVVEDYKSKLDLYKYEKKIGLGRINIDEKIYEMEVIINVIERLQKENETLKEREVKQND